MLRWRSYSQCSRYCRAPFSLLCVLYVFFFFFGFFKGFVSFGDWECVRRDAGNVPSPFNVLTFPKIALFHFFLSFIHFGSEHISEYDKKRHVIDGLEKFRRTCWLKKPLLAHNFKPLSDVLRSTWSTFPNIVRSFCLVLFVLSFFICCISHDLSSWIWG